MLEWINRQWNINDFDVGNMYLFMKMHLFTQNTERQINLTIQLYSNDHQLWNDKVLLTAMIIFGTLPFSANAWD